MAGSLRDKIEPAVAAKGKPRKEEFTVDESDKEVFINSVSFDIADDLEAQRRGGINTDLWRVKKSRRSFWQVPFMGEDGLETKTLWAVQVWLERRDDLDFRAATDAILARLEKKAIKPPKAKRPKTKASSMYEVAVHDVHFGKLAWRDETGEDYDLKICEGVYQNAIEDLLDNIGNRQIEYFDFVIGSDFLHIDNHQYTTTGGTLQDTDGRYAKIMETAEMSLVWAFEMMRKKAPIKAMWIPGNHDTISSYHCARTLKAWFRNYKDVEVDVSPTLRKYVHYGVNLLGRTHGDKEPWSRLPGLMAHECRERWSDSVWREWHVGHGHHKKEAIQYVGQEIDSVMIRQLSSISATDSWHKGKGYCMSQRGAEGFLWHKDNGPEGHFHVAARI